MSIQIRARDLLSFSRVQNQVAKSAAFGFSKPRTAGQTVDVSIDGKKDDIAFIVVHFQGVSERL
jgi:hypothetical protein